MYGVNYVWYYRLGEYVWDVAIIGLDRSVGDEWQVVSVVRYGWLE